MEETISVIVVDDSRLIRDGLISLLSQIPNISITSTAENGEDLLRLLEFSNPDVLLLDVKMPVMDGIEALKIVSKKYPKIKTVMISMYFEVGLIEEFEKIGAWGFIPKGCDDYIIEETISSVYKGAKRFNIGGNYDLIPKENINNKKKFDNKDNLSRRELEIITLICLCKSNKQMAGLLFVTERTIEFHKTNIYKKTKCVNTSDLVLYAIKNELMVL